MFNVVRIPPTNICRGFFNLYHQSPNGHCSVDNFVFKLITQRQIGQVLTDVNFFPLSFSNLSGQALQIANLFL